MKKTTLLFFSVFAIQACSQSAPDDPNDGSVNPCDGITCSFAGQCVDGPAGPACECDEGYHPEGLNCVEDGTTGPCFEVDCSNHGDCVEDNGNAECRCDPGYHPEGLACILDPVDTCEGVNCSFHGQCVDDNGSPRCECDAGYHPEGLHCIEDADSCDGVTCSFHGDCVDDNGTPRCECDAGYHPEGLACIEDVDPCEGIDCSGHGTCVDNNGVAECDCEDGYEADGLECVETLCHCYERNRFEWSNCTYAMACQTASDCCPAADAIAPYVCNQDYPYRYACTNGHCETLTCETASHCQQYFTQTTANSTGNWVNEGCATGECPPHTRWCSFKQTCSNASDCCPVADSIAPYVCNQDYPYVYRCEHGYCKQTLCLQNSHCDRFAAYYPPEDGWVHLGCVQNYDPCTEEMTFGNCQFKKACTVYTDCCDENIGEFTCGSDYPYLYECNDNLCETKYCESNAECDQYFDLIDSNNPGVYVDLGCVSY